MVGFYARADPTHPTRVDFDNKLVDARYFTLEEVFVVLNGATIRSNKELSENFDEDRGGSPKRVQAERAQVDEGPFRMPPATAITGVLIRDWAEERIKLEKIQSIDL